MKTLIGFSLCVYVYVCTSALPWLCLSVYVTVYLFLPYLSMSVSLSLSFSPSLCVSESLSLSLFLPSLSLPPSLSFIPSVCGGGRGETQILKTTTMGISKDCSILCFEQIGLHVLIHCFIKNIKIIGFRIIKGFT